MRSTPSSLAVEATVKKAIETFVVSLVGNGSPWISGTVAAAAGIATFATELLKFKRFEEQAGVEQGILNGQAETVAHLVKKVRESVSLEACVMLGRLLATEDTTQPLDRWTRVLADQLALLTSDDAQALHDFISGSVGSDTTKLSLNLKRPEGGFDYLRLTLAVGSDGTKLEDKMGRPKPLRCLLKEVERNWLTLGWVNTKQATECLNEYGVFALKLREVPPLSSVLVDSFTPGLQSTTWSGAKSVVLSFSDFERLVFVATGEPLASLAPGWGSN